MKLQIADSLDPTVKQLRACADPVRLRLLNLLAEGEVCVCHLHETLGLPQSTVSRHLAYLRRRGFVTGRKQGLWVYYRLTKPTGAVHRHLIALLAACSSEIGMLKRDRDKLDRRSCCPE
jgi:ArsR family transcriptional regulator